MKNFYLFLIPFITSSVLMSQTPSEYSIPAWYLETDNNGNFFAAFGDEVFVFDEDGIVSDTIVSDFDESFGTIVDFRIGMDGKMYLLYDFNNGIYEMDSSGHLTKVLNGRYRNFDVDSSGGILASIENGGKNILRYVNTNLDTVFTLDDNINAANLVFDVQLDDDNTFWIAYAKGILSMTNLELKRHNEESINDLFAAADKRIYVTYDIRKAAYKEPNEDEITKIDFDDALGTRICGDAEGRIYVANDNIVYVFSDGVWTNVEISSSVFITPIDFVVDNKNTVVMSTNQGKMFIWKQDGVSVKENILQHSIKLYPNPSSDFISFSENDVISSLSRYQIISSEGNVVEKGIINNETINIKDLPQGHYSIYIEELGLAWKFVKM